MFQDKLRPPCRPNPRSCDTVLTSSSFRAKNVDVSMREYRCSDFFPGGRGRFHQCQSSNNHPPPPICFAAEIPPPSTAYIVHDIKPWLVITTKRPQYLCTNSGIPGAEAKTAVTTGRKETKQDFMKKEEEKTYARVEHYYVLARFCKNRKPQDRTSSVSELL